MFQENRRWHSLVNRSPMNHRLGKFQCMNHIQWPNIDRQLVVPLIKHDLKRYTITEDSNKFVLHKKTGSHCQWLIGYPSVSSVCQVPGCHAYKLYEGYKRARWLGRAMSSPWGPIDPRQPWRLGQIPPRNGWLRGTPMTLETPAKQKQTNIKVGDSKQKQTTQDLCVVSHRSGWIWYYRSLRSSNLSKWKSDKQYTETGGFPQNPRFASLFHKRKTVPQYWIVLGHTC